MRIRLIVAAFALSGATGFAADEYPPHPDSVVRAGVPHGELVKGSHKARDGSVFPGTLRDYQVYLPAGLDRSKPAPFMVFQDGVIYNAPVVFDNLIATHEIPPLIGIFIQPGVVPAANPDALPRFNRSHEYDSVTDDYSRFLIDEFLPAIEKKHGLHLSTDPNDAATCGNSSGGICAFMTAWHRPDRFRRVFSGVGTYVGIHGADQLPVLVRKMEPKPMRIYLQSGEQDNNLYCGDWWMANQMMERSLTWAGYDVNHTWGTGGHNGKQATAIFPDVMRWLWRDHATTKEIKANPRGDSKWRGYEVLGDGMWDEIAWPKVDPQPREIHIWNVTSNQNGDVFVLRGLRKTHDAWKIQVNGTIERILTQSTDPQSLVAGPDNSLFYSINESNGEGHRAGVKIVKMGMGDSSIQSWDNSVCYIDVMVVLKSGVAFGGDSSVGTLCRLQDGKLESVGSATSGEGTSHVPKRLALSPDQTQLYTTGDGSPSVESYGIGSGHSLTNRQNYGFLDRLGGVKIDAGGLCVDTDGRLYVATALGIQVCDQAGRVNFIIPTPQQPYDVCFGGKDLGELFIACGDRIYKRPTKAHGIVSGQMAPIKPAPPKL